MTEKKNNHTMSQMTHEHHMDHDHNMSMMADSEIDMSAMPMHHHGADMGMAGMDMNDMKRRFWISLILMIPILFISPFMGVNLPFTIVFPGNAWVSALLSAMLYGIGSQPFWVGARQELQAKKPAMMSLITMGLNVTFWYSIYALIATQVFHHHVMDFFWEFATLTVIMLLGHRIEMSATMKAGDATAKLRELLPQIAHVKHGDHIMDMPITTLKSNMVVRVLAGESFPADGIVINGNSQVDESLMTGESQLIDKSTEATVYGGTINGNGTLEVKLTTVGAQSFIGQLQQTLLTSQDKKSQVETIADRVASWLFWVALVFALGALIIWTPLRGFGFATNIAVTVLVIACPHALGLAVPLVISRTRAIAAAQGILIKNRKALSAANQLQYALMDKTGTLTTGQFTVQQLVAYQDNQSHVLAIMSALDQQSTHPLAQSIISYAQSQGAPTLSAQHVENIAGYGVSGMIEDNHYLLVSARYLTEHHIDFEPLNTDGSISYLLNHDKVIAAIAQGDSVKESARQFIDDLHAQHIIPVLVTGDNEKSAKRVAHELGIEAIHAGVSPQEKIALVAEYQKRGAVMMIGDGINDAPALAHADLSVAIGAGTQVAQASADTVLITNHLPKIIDFIRLAKHGNTKQVQNLWWGAGYNIITIPLAAGALSFIGLMLNPMIGAIVMSFSTIVVSLNALTLKG